MAGVFRPRTKNAGLVNLGGVDYIFTKISPLQDQADSSEYADGTGARKHKVIGSFSLQDVTLQGNLDTNVSGTLEQFLKAYKGDYLTITIQPINPYSKEQEGKPYILEGCLIKSYQLVEIDQMASDVMTVSITLSVNTWTR
jgi:hypothetical protein